MFFRFLKKIFSYILGSIITSLVVMGVLYFLAPDLYNPKRIYNLLSNFQEYRKLMSEFQSAQQMMTNRNQSNQDNQNKNGTNANYGENVSSEDEYMEKLLKMAEKRKQKSEELQKLLNNFEKCSDKDNKDCSSSNNLNLKDMGKLQGVLKGFLNKYVGDDQMDINSKNIRNQENINLKNQRNPSANNQNYNKRYNNSGSDHKSEKSYIHVEEKYKKQVRENDYRY